MSDFLRVEAGIRQLHARYTDAVWRRDFDAFGDCWTEDAEWRLASYVHRGRPQIVAAFQASMNRYSRCLITIRTPIIELGPDGTATARTYATEQTAVAGGGYFNTIATYYERLVEREGQWRRAWAFFQLFYIGPADLSAPFVDLPDYGPPPAMPPPDEPTLPVIRPAAP
jgi:uncharacterized protein (TIGR02246 family)